MVTALSPGVKSSVYEVEAITSGVQVEPGVASETNADMLTSLQVVVATTPGTTTLVFVVLAAAPYVLVVD